MGTVSLIFRSSLPTCLALCLAACGGGGGDGGGDPPPPPTLGFAAEKVFTTHREVDGRFMSADGTVLAGTLLLPATAGAARPTVVMSFGSNAWTRFRLNAFTAPLLNAGLAVFSYDKRGTGESGGFHQNGYAMIPTFATDIVAAHALVATHPEVDPTRLGHFGHSQGGWTVPLAVATGNLPAAFMVLGGAPAVSTGEDFAYGVLSGKHDSLGNVVCLDLPVDDDFADTVLDMSGTGIYDPRPVLAGLGQVPTLWVWGELERIIPLRRSQRVVEALRGDGRDWDTLLLPRTNHAFVIDGTMCQATGTLVDWQTPTLSWLRPRVLLP